MKSTNLSDKIRIFRSAIVISILVVVIFTINHSGSVIHASGMNSEDMPGQSELPWLFIVYIVTWAAFFAYVLILSRRQNDMMKEIAFLKQSLKKSESTEN